MSPNFQFSLLFVVFVAMSFVKANEDITVIYTTDGAIKGRVMLSTLGRVFIGFQSVPYAMPPVGELRFRPPKPVEPWTHVHNAREEGNMCTQFQLNTKEVVGSEDCLTLNVFTHRHSTKVPILVWVHGGMFHAGNAGVNWNGPDIIMDNNIVYVTINYRLGPLGFMSTGDSHLPGNYGLKDQVLALKWIKRNAEHFGGDPNTITVYGSGAGGVCTHYHMFSPLSSGLFSRLIYQSGSVLNFWAFQRNPLKATKHLAEMVNCSTTPTKTMVDCLKQIPVEHLVATIDTIMDRILRKPHLFAPVQEFQSENSDDPPFLTANPEYLLKAGFLNNAPVISGNTKDEYAPLARLIHEDLDSLMELEENFVDVIRKILYLHSFKASAIHKIRSFYLGDGPVMNASLRQLTDMFSDGLVLHGVHRAARLQAASSIMPVYFYIMAVDILTDESDLEDGSTDNSINVVRKKKTFPNPRASSSVTVDSYRRLWSLLSSFCATGNPTPGKPKLIPLLWRPVGRTGKFRYLRIDDDLGMNEMGERYIQRMEFWDSIYHETEVAQEGTEET